MHWEREHVNEDGVRDREREGQEEIRKGEERDGGERERERTLLLLFYTVEVKNE